jgi:hypothetical protein
MKFLFPIFPAEFALPDEWWGDSGMTGFTPVGAAYRSKPDATLVPLLIPGQAAH